MPDRLEEGLPAMGCKQCEGKLVSLLYYRDWAQRSTAKFSSVNTTFEKLEDNDSKTALSCSKCSRIMNKYKITAGTSNKLDVCVNCDEAWIDKDEWGYLKSLNLADNFTKIFTDQWQSAIRKEEFDSLALGRLIDEVGEDNANKAKDVREWLSRVKNKSAILHFLARD